jgi:ElaB/YqjD/DUF883 family membrane-anchored ribosome-binding protein
MFESLPEDTQGEHVPQPEARPPVSPPVQDTAPVDPEEQSFSHEDESGAEVTVGGFTLQQGGGGMTGTAERIGTAVGNAQREAQRQVRRGLELVRRPTGRPITEITTEVEEHVSQIAIDTIDRASHVLHDIEEKVSEARREAVHKMDEWSDTAGERFQQLRSQARRALSNSNARAKELADAYPLQTIAAIAGVCFALGVALRFRRSHRG